MKSINYCINVDWLQVFCHDDNVFDLDGIYNRKGDFQFIKQEFSSRHFKEIWHVVDCDGDDYAVVQRKPCSSILSGDAAIIQLCNRELYRPMMASRFVIFLKEHGFRYKSISRLDLCYDCNNLANGMSFPSFIKGIMASKFLKNNQSKVKWHFDSMANVGKPMECNSASFGSRSSAVSVKMYNKTMELKEVKNKPYIVECWRYNGLDVDKDVWRIEFSIKSEAATAVKTMSGEIFKLNLSLLEFQEQVESVFFGYAGKYFDFKKNDGTKNKSRMQSLPIFPDVRKPTIRPIRITDCTDSSRADKIFLKKLHSLFDELKNCDLTTERALWEVSNAFVLSKSMSHYRDRVLLNCDEAKRHADEYLNMEYRINSLIKDIRMMFAFDGPDIVRELETIMNNIKNIRKLNYESYKLHKTLK